jgi:signal transduction histidine kinase
MKRRQALILAAKGLLIKDWLFLGPFDRKIAGTAREKKIAEKVYHSVPGGGDTQWERKYEKDDYGYVNLSDIYGTRNYAVSYAFTYVFSLERRQVLLKMGSDDGIAVWINSMKVWDNTIRRSAEVDDDVVPVLFEAGWNLILLRLSQDWGGWGFYFRVTDMDGKNIKELIFDPLKNDERADILLREYRREQLMKRIRYGVLSAAGIVIILVSLVMLMLNIRAAYRIKRMREDFTGSITHDLRIPLSSIMAYSERLKDGDVRPEEKKHEYYDIILSEAERLNRYINKILEIFREKKGTTVYSMKNEAVVPLIEKAVDIYKTESVSEDLRIFVKAAGILPDIPLDKDAFLQVIINLLSNADKYSPDNKNIEIELLKDKDYIVIRVKDRGIGISKHDSGKIFDKFYRVDTETVHARKGIGLGLAFVKSIITAHNGMINVEPRRGGGSVFIVMLPVER